MYIKPINVSDEASHGGFAEWAGIMPNDDGSVEIFQGGYYAMYVVGSSGHVTKQYAIVAMHYIEGSNNYPSAIKFVGKSRDADVIIIRWGDDPRHYLVEVFTNDSYVVIEDNAVVHSGLRYAGFITELEPSSPPAVPEDNYITQYELRISTGSGTHEGSYYKYHGWFIEYDLSRSDIEILPAFILSENEIVYTFFY